MSFALLISLLACSQLAAANYGVLDIFSSDADCTGLGAVQASIRREVGICWNLTPEISDCFHLPMFDGKQSYRIESCDNSSPFLTTSISGHYPHIQFSYPFL